MKKIILHLICLFMLCCLLGCGATEAENVMAVDFYVDCSDIYGIAVDSYADGNLLRTDVGCNADGSPLSTRYPLRFSYVPGDLPQTQIVELQISVLDEKQQTFPCEASVLLSVSYNTVTQLQITGDFVQGFSALQK